MQEHGTVSTKDAIKTSNFTISDKTFLMNFCEKFCYDANENKQLKSEKIYITAKQKL